MLTRDEENLWGQVVLPKGVGIWWSIRRSWRLHHSTKENLDDTTKVDLDASTEDNLDDSPTAADDLNDSSKDYLDDSSADVLENLADKPKDGYRRYNEGDGLDDVDVDSEKRNTSERWESSWP